MMPEPTTAVRSSPVPTASATSRRDRVAFARCSLLTLFALRFRSELELGSRTYAAGFVPDIGAQAWNAGRPVSDPNGAEVEDLAFGKEHDRVQGWVERGNRTATCIQRPGD